MNKEYKRICPNCGKEITYSLKGNFKRAKINNVMCFSCSKSGKNHPLFGKKQTEERKRKQRVALLKRFEKLGIPACKDKGADEFFNWINSISSYNFEPTKFYDIGYFADGYDSKKHIWVEYDTEYHNKPHQQKKDMIRQNNIIEYFEGIGKPLISFYRAKSSNVEPERFSDLIGVYHGEFKDKYNKQTGKLDFTK